MKFYEPQRLKKVRPALLTLGIAASCAFALSAPSVFAGFTSRSVTTNNQAVAGRLLVELVDANGSISTAPVMSVTGAMPSMTAKTSTVRFKNNGTLPAAVVFHSNNVTASSASNLDSVLVARVLDSNNNQLYSGSLSGMSVNFASVAPGATVVLTLELTWPDLPAVDDNPYQDASLSFELLADASAITA